MVVSLLSPLSALVALAVVAPLVAFVLGGKRSARVAAALRLPAESRRRRLVTAGALGSMGVLLGLAATQPIISLEDDVRVRKDVRAYVVFDTSKSMLASAAYRAPNRLERAKAFALRLRSELADVPFGVASMTDRALPHLLPTADGVDFEATAQRAIGIERPPAEIQFTGRATTMQALSAFATLDFFGNVRHRLLVVVTDGESRPFVDASIGAQFRRGTGIDAIFVHFWGPSEQIYLEGGAVDPEYGPDPQSTATIAGLAAVTGGRAFAETELAATVQAVREVIGDGPVADERPERRRIQLARYFALAAFLPLGLVLYRRNL